MGLFVNRVEETKLLAFYWYDMRLVCVCGGGGGVHARVCMRVKSLCVRACVCAFILYALNFDNMYL